MRNAMLLAVVLLVPAVALADKARDLIGLGMAPELAAKVVLLESGTNLPDSPATGAVFLDTNDGACDNANDGGGTAVCAYNGSAWVLLGNSGS